MNEQAYKFDEKPRFDIGQQVTCPPTLYGETVGTVYEIRKRFTNWEDGSTLEEHTIMTPECNQRWIGDTILTRKMVTVITGNVVTDTYFSETEDDVYHFDGYFISVRSEKGNTRFSENVLNAA